MGMRLRASWGKATLTLVVLSTGVALSAGLGYTAHQEIERTARLRFEAEADELARKVEDRFDAYTEVLIGLRALFHTSERVSAQQFRQYVEGLDVASHFPGFQVLNYAAYVPVADKAEFEQRQHAIAPPGVRPDYHPITLIEPLAGNEAAVGKDLA